MLSWLRKRVRSGNISTDESQSLVSIDKHTLEAFGRITHREHCECLSTQTKKGNLSVPNMHVEPQLEVNAWTKTQKTITNLEKSGNLTFEPSKHMSWTEWIKMITLPSEIETLSQVKTIRMYGSHLRRLPPEIGKMVSLSNLDIYTSYSLHWLPYELTRCRNISDSRMSTRAFYGNKKTRLPFPRISNQIEEILPKTCSVCDRSFSAGKPDLLWTTQRIGTDIVPLLVHSCSVDCTKSIPSAPKGFHEKPHKGGGGVGMPNRDL